jgi:DNA-directed RNA polymerase specialized sigma24 family protein
LQLTNQDHHRAENLMHDAFVQFALSRPDLKHIQNLEAYLYMTLKNTHLSQAAPGG